MEPKLAVSLAVLIGFSELCCLHEISTHEGLAAGYIASIIYKTLHI